MNRFISIANIVLFIAVIALLAAISGQYFTHKLLPTPTAAISKTGSASKQPTQLSTRNADLSFYSPILTQALFGSATKGELSAFVNAPVTAQAAPVTAPSELQLLGTATGSRRETFALVRHTTKQEERVFRLGDLVFDAGQLVEVGREQAFILINGKKVELLSPTSPQPAKSATTAGHPAPAPTTVAVANQGGNNYVIDQRALNAALDNPAQAMTDARLLPSQKDGVVEGFKASEVKPQGVFGMIGIKNGDIIKSLNDFPMDAPDKALQSFIALKGQSRLKMDIIRDGQPQTLTYDIR